MKRVFTLVALLCAISFGASAQRMCGAMEHHEHLLQTDPNYAARQQEIETFTNQFIQDHANEERALVTIPVVFHVLYNTTAQNVSTAQLNAQLAQLNLDYARLNADWTNTPSVFQSATANTQIQFCLASVDPSGNATTGIERKQTSTASFSQNDAVKSGTLTSTSGGLNAWPAASYLNIWVCNQSGGVLGYAQFPGGAASTDGVVLHYNTVGSVASPFTGGAPYNLGRTATHEVGHWLNLRHIWGDAACGNDLVSDTPTSSTSNFGCPTFPHVTCSNGPNGDMFMNYMDYTDDACMYMFTNGQAARMQALFATGGSRASLLNSTGCGVATGCGTPVGLTASAITTTGATIAWGAVGGALSYNVQYKLSSSATWTTTSTSATSLALSGLVQASVYNFQVQAVCSAAAGTYSSTASFTTASTATCGTPSGLAASAITSSGATLSWGAISGATSYNVQYKTSTATTWTTVTSTTASRVLTGLVASTLYNFQVQAVCSVGTSAFSTAGSFTTTTVTTGCTDVYESNNTLATAKPISAGTAVNALISSTTDRDYFSFTTTSAARNIRIDLSNLPADYDVRLYNPSGTSVGLSQNGGTTAELIRYNNGAIGTYKVYVFGYGGAFSTSQCYNLLVSTSSVAFRESDDSEITPSTEAATVSQMEVVAVFPNPASDEVNVTFNSANDGAVNITLIDITGREVYATKFGAMKGLNKTQFSISDFASGYYTLVLNDGVTRSTIKVVKK